MISQGRVEAIIHSKPADRTALIEEAAGLTKHRKRRHRAQLKLNRTQDNLDRALDVEREARSRLRPLKRQAEAAELHARLERQTLEARSALLGDDLRAARAELAGGRAARRPRARERATASTRELMEVAQRPRGDRAALRRARSRARAALRAGLRRRSAAVDRISLRVESAAASAEALRERGRALGARARAAAVEPERRRRRPQGRLAELEAELERLEAERAARLDDELAGARARARGGRAPPAELGGGAGDDRARARAAAAETAAVRIADARPRRPATPRRAPRARSRSSWSASSERCGSSAGGGAARRLRRGSTSSPATRPRWRRARRAAGRARRPDRRRGRARRSSRRGRGRPRPRARRARADRGRGRGPRCPARSGCSTACDPQPTRPTSRRACWPTPGSWTIADAARGLRRHRGHARRHRIRRPPRRGPAPAGRRRRAGSGGAQPARRASRPSSSARRASSRRRARPRSARAAAAAAPRSSREGLEARMRDARRGTQEAEEEARRLAWLIEQRREHGGGPEDARRAQLERRDRRRAPRRRAARARAARGARRGSRPSSARSNTTGPRCPQAERLLAAMQAGARRGRARGARASSRS